MSGGDDSASHLLATALPAPSDDPEGARLPDGLPPVPVVDAHVHLFPDRLFAAVRRWFDAHAWPIRYRLDAAQTVELLRARGVDHVVALTYAHKPGLARALNDWMAAFCRSMPHVTGLGTVFPGEEGAAAIVADAFAAGLGGLKLHCHVQCFAPDDPTVAEVYEACAAAGRPLVMHAGREPQSPAYRCDPHTLCAAERVARVLAAHPRLKLVVPHLGADEFGAYERLLERHDNLWLDTTMMLADFFPGPPPRRLLQMRPERVMYGTDFPNIPYAWDREIVRLARMGLGDDALAQIVGGTARALFVRLT
jgi:predicted TIM-barrel fold metal-dependent hydrolase